MAASKSSPRKPRAPREKILKLSDRELAYVPHFLEEFPEGLPECVALDLETTGTDGWAHGDRIIEVAAVRYDRSGREVGRIDTLIKIGFAIPPIVVEITHITDKMLTKSGRDLSEVLDELATFLADRPIIIGHNINFDIVFLHDAYTALGKPVPEFHAFCTRVASSRLFPDAVDQKLGTVAKALGVELVEAHRAGPDAVADYEVARMLVERFNDFPMPDGVIYRTDVPDRLRDRVRSEIDAYIAQRAADEGKPRWQILTYMALESMLREVPSSRADIDRLVGIAPAQAAREGDGLWAAIERARAA